MAPVGMRTRPLPHALKTAGLVVRTPEEDTRREAQWKAAIADMVEQLLASCTADEHLFLKDFVFKTPERIASVRQYPQGSKPWAEARVGLMTMSDAGKYLGHNAYCPNEDHAVQETIFGVFTGNKYTDWGDVHEDEARDLYVSIERPKVAQLVSLARAAGQSTFVYAHREFPCRLPEGSGLPDTPEGWFFVAADGLSISEDYPWLGASPDGIITIMGRPVGCLEIKCPAKQPLQPYTTAPLQYCDQVAGQQLILNVGFCHFFVWTPHRWTMSHIEFDLDYCYGTVVRYLTESFFSRLLPLMTVHRSVVVAKVMSRVDKKQQQQQPRTATAVDDRLPSLPTFQLPDRVDHLGPSLLSTQVVTQASSRSNKRRKPSAMTRSLDEALTHSGGVPHSIVKRQRRLCSTTPARTRKPTLRFVNQLCMPDDVPDTHMSAL